MLLGAVRATRKSAQSGIHLKDGETFDSRATETASILPVRRYNGLLLLMRCAVGGFEHHGEPTSESSCTVAVFVIGGNLVE